MNRALPISLLFPALFILTGCGRSPSERVLDEFVQLNDSLQTFSDRLDSTWSTADSTTFIDHDCPELQAQADSLRMARQEVSALLKAMKEHLTNAAIDDRIIGDSLFLANGNGELLFQQFKAFYALAVHQAPDSATAAHIKRLQQQVFLFPSAEHWREQDFHHVPRIAITTILTRMEADIQHLEKVRLNNMLERCREKR